MKSGVEEGGQTLWGLCIWIVIGKFRQDGNIKLACCDPIF